MKLSSMRISVCVAVALATVASVQNLQATPYASSLTNNAGTIQFNLNEPGSTVVVTYEDGTTNASFNGLTTGTNLPAGQQSFLLAAHSSYAITVTKVGTGTPSLIKSLPLTGNPRGVDVNKNVASPYFGRVYQANGGGSPAGVYLLNPDLTYAYTNVARNGGITTFGSAGTTTGQSPYRLWVAPDDSVIVGDATTGGSAVYQIDPAFSTNSFNKLILGPVGNTAALAAGSHGTIQSRPLLIGSTNGGNAVLYDIDGEISPPNSLLSYNIGSGPLPWTGAPVVGPNVGISLNATTLGGNEYPGLTRGPNGYFYCSTYRNDLSRPIVQVYAADGVTPVWNSWTPDGTAYPGGTPSGDYFLKTIQGFTSAMVDTAVSADGNYLVGVNINNAVVICGLTNGIPNAASIFTVNATSTTGNGRGIAWDAALNYYMSSSGIGAVQEWSLGITAKAITTGNASGQTNFALVLPATKVSVTATTPAASQSGPTPGVFTITRSSTVSADTNAPLTVSYAITGTATNGSFTVSGGTLTNVTLAAGQNSTNITITPVNDGVSRPTTSVILTLVGSGSYAVTPPLSDVVLIQNTGPQYVLISSAPGSSLYKGLTNDHASFVVTRWGDTNAPSYTVSSFTYAGTAVSNVAYLPAEGITFNPGDVNITNITLRPLVDTTNYVGNKTIILGLATGAGYTGATNKVNLTIIDNANLPAAVLWANPLTDVNDSTNWGITSANNDMLNVGIDNTVEFGYDLTANNGESANNGLISLPPSGATNCLRVTVNKNGSGRAAGVNLYPTNVTFSGDYAVRFAMNITEGNSAAYTTEGPLFGINHTGTATNWWTGTALISGWDPAGTNLTWTSDGIWYSLIADGGASAGDFIEKTGAGGTNGNAGWQTLASGLRATYANIFKNPTPYSTLNGTVPAVGIPANISPYNAQILGNPYTNAWADVEIKTVKNKVTMAINKTAIFTYTNTTVWTNGTLMLGYNDPFSSTGGGDAAVYFSDIKVVRLAPPQITLQPTNLIIAVGSPATFGVGVNYDSSSAVTNGQWLLNGTPIAGATNNTYSITVAAASYGTYSWTVNDGNYSVTSSNATLRPPAFTILTNPVPSIVVSAGTATNVVSAANSFGGVTNYQWQINAANITGATNRIYSFTAAPTNYGTFRVVINDGWNFATSTVAVVAPPVPVFLTLPATHVAIPGGSTTFSVVAQTFSGATNYQWFTNTVAIAGATAATLSLPSLAAGNFGLNYVVRVSDGTTSITSSPPATLTAALSPNISSPGLVGANFKLSFGTELGVNYVVESKTNLLQPAWIPVKTNAGTGGAISVTNATSGAQGFFHVRLQ